MEGSVDVVDEKKVERVRSFLAEGAEVRGIAALVFRDHDPRVSSDVAA